MIFKARMFVISFLISVLLIGAYQASAAYIKRDQKSGEIFLQDEQQEDTQPQAPPSPGAQANDFYKNCIAQEHPILKGEMLELFCGCTSAKMTETMTPEQVAIMNTDSKEGQYQRNRMLMFVYTPCIAYPTEALVTQQCLSQKDKMKRPLKTCPCVGKGMGEYMTLHAPKVIERALRRNAKDLDPLRMLLESRSFDDQAQYYMSQCIAKHELNQGR